jgi:hypothetical protein
MKNLTKLICIAIVAIFTGTSAIALAADAATSGGAIVVSDSVHAKATVVKVNKKTREITLKNEQGDEMTVVAGKEVRNFKQIKKGDVVEIEYHVAAASALKKVGDADAAGQATVVERAPAGGKPGASVMHTSTAVADVLDIDMQSRMLTVKGPRGGIVTIKVPAEMKTFDELKKGDKISVQFTEAMAISVKTPAKKKK